MAQIAVITRTKDRPVFLERALDSVHGQTFKDIEHIIVNDGGDEESVELAVNNLSADAKQLVRVLHRKNSSNAPDTIFNESIDASSAEFIVIHDDDDTWHTEFLERTVGHLKAHKDIGGVVAKTDKVLEQLKGSQIKRLKTLPWLDHIKVVNLYHQCAENQLTPIAFVFRRAAYKKVGKFDSSLPVAGDWEFGIRFLMEYDVDLLDPGFSLAFYHHRKFEANQQGNTSYGGNDKHRYYTNQIRNRYLRKELKSGSLGPGYIMSKIRYEQSYISMIAKKIMPNSLAEKLKKRASR